MEERKRILLVETNIFFSARLVGQLKKLGYDVEVSGGDPAARGKSGVGTSAVIVDLAAKGLDAAGIIKKLKGAPETASIPVIGFCGHAEAELIESARSAGCDLVTTNGRISSDLPGVLAEAAGL